MSWYLDEDTEFGNPVLRWSDNVFCMVSGTEEEGCYEAYDALVALFQTGDGTVTVQKGWLADLEGRMEAAEQAADAVTALDPESSHRPAAIAALLAALTPEEPTV